MKQISARRRGVIRVVAAIVPFIAPLAATAQDSIPPVVTSTPYATPAEMLARLESGERNISTVITAAFEKDRRIDGSKYLGNYDRYTDAERHAILDGVERIARGVGGGAFAAVAEYQAFNVLGNVGRDPALREPYEIPDRLLRIYEQAKKDDVKLIAVLELGRLLREQPAAAPRITDLLVSLVNQPVTYRQTLVHGDVPVVEGPVHPDAALDALLSACEAGVPALRRLQANRSAIQHRDVQERVDSAGRAGFAPGRMRLSSTGMDPCTRDRPGTR